MPFAATAAPAGAVTVDTEVRATGQLAVSWRGEPAFGCAARGVCDVRGNVVLRAGPGNSGSSTTGPADAQGLEDLDLPSLPGVVRVLRGAPGEVTGACVDRLEGFGGAVLAVRRTQGGRTRLGLRSRRFGPQGLELAGRCAGPLPSDVEAALPSASIPSGLLRSGRGRVALTGTRAFRAGPFAGEVASTLRVSFVRRVRADRSDERSGRSVSVDDDGPRGRTRQLLLRYRVASLGGTLRTDFAGGPLCAGLSPCDLQGTHELRAAGAPGGELTVVAIGPASAFRGTSVAAGLRALRAGRLEVFGFQRSGRSPRAAAAATVRRGAALACADERPLTLQPLQVQDGGDGLRFGLDLSSSARDGSDPVRTRCEGPAARDLLGDRGRLEADLTATALGAARAELALRPGRQETAGFALRSTGAVIVRLERLSARVRGGER